MNNQHFHGHLPRLLTPIPFPIIDAINCQALSISLSLNLSLSLRNRDRADTIINFHHNTPPTPKTF